MNRLHLRVFFSLFCSFAFFFFPTFIAAQCSIINGTYSSDDQIRMPSTSSQYRIRITARGADGGNYGPTTGKGGSGAVMEAEFTVYANDLLDIYIGKAGGTKPGTPVRGGGGGGGSAVVINNNIVLIAAAGGGGPGGNTLDPDHGRGGLAGISSFPTGGTTLTGHGAGGGGFGEQNKGEGPGGGGAATLNLAGDGGPGISGAGSGGDGFGGGGGGGGQAGGGGGGFRGGDGGIVSGTGSTYAGGDGGNSFVTEDNSYEIIAVTPGVDGAGQLRNGEVIIQCIAAVLPVEWIAFSGKPAAEGILLTWRTTSEVDNYGFEVEHSLDGVKWQKNTFVKGQGNTTETSSYNYLHENPAGGLNYYRLKQIDHDGDFEYSDLINVILKQIETMSIFPNPSSGHILLSGTAIDNASVEIANYGGKVVKRMQLSGPHINISDLPSGIYFLTLKTPDKTYRKQIIRQ